jgi:hypothetical protein
VGLSQPQKALQRMQGSFSDPGYAYRRLGGWRVRLFAIETSHLIDTTSRS